MRLLLLKHWDQDIGILNILNSNKNLHAGDNNLHHPNCIQRCWFDHHTIHHHSNQENHKRLVVGLLLKGMGLLLLRGMQLLYHQYLDQGIHIYQYNICSNLLHTEDNNLHHPNCIQRCLLHRHTTHRWSMRENYKHLVMGLLLKAMCWLLLLGIGLLNPKY